MEKNNITRRDFLKISGAGALALGAAACKSAVPAASSSEPAGDGKMPLRTNPNSGDQVSLLGYGCMRWQMKKDADGNEIVNQESVDELVDYAMAHGINYFDSAPVYLQGQSERATALALLRYPRDSYFIATKLSSNSRVMTFEKSVQMYRQSLANYETDYIDYYLLHNIGSVKEFNDRFITNGVIDFLLNERSEGRIRNLGFSFHGNGEAFDELLSYHDRFHWDFVQIQMNYIDWTHADPPAKEMYEKLTERGIPVVIMEPLLGGGLSSVPDVVANMLKEREPSKSVASWAFRFCGTMPNVLTTLSGMTYMDHLQDNLDTFCNFKPLSDEELEMLENAAGIIQGFPLVSCTGCQYCMPCPYGINIPGIFKHYNNAVNDGIVAVSKEQKDFKQLKRKYLTSYDKAIDSVRQADHCIHCNACARRCPQHIRIPDELRRIDRYVESLKRETL